jgi:Pycsar effector protein
MFRKHQDRSEPASVNQTASESSISFAWRIHSAITDWTAKVDTKAAIVLSLGGVVLGFFVTLSGHGRILSGLHGWSLVLERIGLSITILGVLLASLVVAPRLNRREARSAWRENIIYFGHLRFWNSQDLADKLQSLNADQQTSILATQLVATSKIAWRKHRLLQFSMLCIVGGTSLVALAATFFK